MNLDMFTDDNYFAEESILSIIEDYKAQRVLEKETRRKHAEEWDKFKRRMYDMRSKDPEIRRRVAKLDKMAYTFYESDYYDDNAEARAVARIRKEINELADIFYNDKHRPKWVEREYIYEFITNDLIYNDDQ